jgi:uncharacterized protein YdiU (UPF0061 family)
VQELPALLRACETDLTLFMRGLAELDCAPDALADCTDEQLLAPLLVAYYRAEQLAGQPRAALLAWLRRYLARAHQDGAPHAERRARMNAVNPKYVLRNYLAQLAIDQAEQGDASLLVELHQLVRKPYDEQPGKERFAEKRPDWARTRAGCSMLSCSS